MIMSTAKMREHLHEYINQADNRMLNLIFSMFQADILNATIWYEEKQKSLFGNS
jgi:hypothetical protein